MRSLREEPWSLATHDRADLEDSVADWMSRQESKAWVASSIVLGILLGAIVLFALSRPV